MSFQIWDVQPFDWRSVLTRIRIFARTLATLLLAFPSLALASDITLKFDPTTPVTGTSVGFNVQDYGVLSSAAIANLPLHSQLTQANKYLLMVDTQSFRRDKFQGFSFDAYVKRASDNSALSVYKFTVSEGPTGTFSDFKGPVTAHISGPSGDDFASIEIPQHSDDSPNLDVDVPKDPYPISMGGSSRMTLGIKSKLSSLHLTVDRDIKITPTICPDCWGQFSAKVLHEHLGTDQSTSLIIDAQPNTMAAFKRNSFEFNSGSTQEWLVVTILSAADNGGLEIPQDFRIPIRFTPPKQYLFLSIAVGAAIGCLIGFMISLIAPPRLTMTNVAVQFAIAIVVWLLALALFATKTKVTVFGYDLDPTQIVPAGLIALLAAGGAPLAKKIKDALGGKP